MANSPDEGYYVASGLSFANRNSDLYADGPLGNIDPNFAAHAAAAKPHFEAVARDLSMPLADDAAYMLGWLAHHQGKRDEAMADFSQAMIVGNGDYSGAATSEVIRIFAKYPARQQYALVESHAGFAKQPALWYVARAPRTGISTMRWPAKSPPTASMHSTCPQTPCPRQPIPTVSRRVSRSSSRLSGRFECGRTALCERGFKGNFAVSGLFELGGHATAGCPL